MFLELRECKARSNSVSEGSKYLLTLVSSYLIVKVQSKNWIILEITENNENNENNEACNRLQK